MVDNFTFIVVVGSQRSGTTLTAQMLGAHSSCLLVDENDGLYDWFFPLVNQSHQKIPFNQLIENSCRKYVSSKGRCVGNSVDDRRITHIVLKAPNLTYYSNAISRVFNNVKVVYARRDIRSIVLSIRQLSHVPIVINQTRLMSSIPHVSNKYDEELLQLKSKGVPEHIKAALVVLIKSSFEQEFLACGLDVVNLYYEELVISPSEVMGKTLSYVGLGYEDECVNYVGMYRGRAPGGTDRSKGVSRKSLKLWKTMLSDREINDIEKVAEHFLERHKDVEMHLIL